MVLLTYQIPAFNHAINMKLLFFIAIFILSYYLISKYLLPYIVKRFIRKAQEQFGNYGQQQQPQGEQGGQGQGQQQPQGEIKKEGEVSVKYVPPEARKAHFEPENSEDVDFEEIKDK